jgi:hypothetical protein
MSAQTPTPEPVNELIEILDERFTQLQPRDCNHLIHALIDLRDLRELLDRVWELELTPSQLMDELDKRRAALALSQPEKVMT